MVAEAGLNEVEPQLREDARRRAPAHRFEPPRRARAGDDHDDEQLERQRYVRERRAPEAPRRDPREQHGLSEDEQRSRQPERDVDPE